MSYGFLKQILHRDACRREKGYFFGVSVCSLLILGAYAIVSSLTKLYSTTVERMKSVNEIDARALPVSMNMELRNS